MKGANETSPLLSVGSESTPQEKKQAGAGLDNKPPSPNDVRELQLQQQAKYLLEEVHQAKSSRFCVAIGLLAVFSVCLVLVLAVFVLLSKPEDQDALQTFVGKNWPWVLSFVVFSSFTAALLWKMESGQAKIDQKFDHNGQMLDGISTLIKRQHEENNLVMSAMHLVQNVTSKIEPQA